MGAVTVAIKKRNFVGASKEVIADVTFSSSYGAGGDTFTLANFEMQTIDSITPCGPAVASATTGYDVMPDLSGLKLRLIGGAASGAALTESGTAGQSSTVARVTVRGNNPYV